MQCTAAGGTWGFPVGDEELQKPRRYRANAAQYYDLLMRAHTKREDEKLKEEDEKVKAEREAVAKHFKKMQVRAEEAAKKAAERQALIDAGKEPPPTPSVVESSASSSHETEEGDETFAGRAEKVNAKELGGLVAYEGVMEVELEIVIMPAPGEDEASVGEGTEVSKALSSEGSPRSDEEDPDAKRRAAEELARLKEELGEDQKEESDEEEVMPENLGQENIWDNPDPRWSLGLGGTVFFVPDAERYARAPSLPPPPPPSMLGRRRLRLKPRLPLVISNHRYRDEHPNIFPEAPFSPKEHHRKGFEQTLATYDFYASCAKAMDKVPEPEREREKRQYQEAVGKLVDEETFKSAAWRAKLMREHLKAERKRQREKRRQELMEQAKEQVRKTVATLPTIPS